MKATLELKAAVLGMISAVAALGVALAAGRMFQPSPPPASASGVALVVPLDGTPARRGYTLFLMNCAHCHGDDARGDEGPDLHGVTKSDARIASMIKNGVKGEMPKFGSKLSDADVRALIAFVRTLNN